VVHTAISATVPFGAVSISQNLSLGITAGFVLAVVTGRMVSGLLYDVSLFDPPAFAIAALLLAMSVFVATWLPARRKIQN
jgi:hypothetical protein